MNKTARSIVISALALTLIAGATTAALAGTNALTKDTIAARNEETANAARQRVITADRFEARQLETDDGAVTYFEAVKGDAVVGYVFTTVTVGKSAGLTVMTGIAADGTVSGVAVTDDNETAGYVAKVEKGGLLAAFRDKKAAPLTLGKDIDGVSQATKTSRGILDGVNQAIAYYQSIVKGGADRG